MGVFEHFPYVNFHEQNVDWLLKRVKKLGGQMDEMQATLADIKEDIKDVTSETLQQLIDSGAFADMIDRELLDNIGGRVSKLENLGANKMLLIGDSYNWGTGAVAGQGWGYYLQQLTGATCDIVHQNGGGFAVAGNNNASYPGATYAGLVSYLDDNAGYDLIVVQGGWNDASPSANPAGIGAVKSGVQGFITAIKNKYYNAKLVILPCYNDTYPLSTQQSRLRAMADVAAQNGVRTCYDAYFWMQNSGYNSSDNIHLTDAGYQRLAGYIYAFLSGWSGDITFWKDITNAITINTASGITTYQNLTIVVTKDYCLVDGDITLPDVLTDWTILLDKLPAPKNKVCLTMMTWDAEFKRGVRVEVEPEGDLHVRYGAAGNYRLNIVYPINIMG